MYVCTNFGRSHGQRVRIYPLRFPLQGQKHFCPRQRVYKARNMNWRFTLIVRQEVRVCRINSHSRETRVSNIPSCHAVERKRRQGFSTLTPMPPSKVYPKKARRELVHVSSLCAQHFTIKVFLRFTDCMTNRRWLIYAKFALTRFCSVFSKLLEFRLIFFCKRSKVKYWLIFSYFFSFVERNNKSTGKTDLKINLITSAPVVESR